MKAVVFDKLGSRVDDYSVLQLRDLPVPIPGENEVLVKMIMAPVNWSDFIFISGQYGDPRIPRFPNQIAGITGTGVVVKGGSATRIASGTRVSFSRSRTWAEYAVVAEASLIPLPDALPIHIATQIGNPITAWDLVQRARVGPGGWLAVTAGNSVVALAAAQFAARAGISVLALVRRKKPHVHSSKYGIALTMEVGDSNDDLTERIKDATDGKGLNGVLDCVGGAAMVSIAKACSPFARIIVYGAMTNDQIGLTNQDIMGRFLTIETYGYRYFFCQPGSDAAFLNRVLEVASRPDFIIPQPAAIYPIERFRDAVSGHLYHSTNGKHFIALSDSRAK